MNRKPRSDSVLDRLPDKQREALVKWLLVDNVSYTEAQERLSREFGVRSSLPALSGFYQRLQQQRLLERISQAKDLARSIKGELAASNTATLPTIELVAQRAFELAVQESPDVRDLSQLTSLLLKARQMDLDERRIKLLETKAAQADAAGEVVKSDLSPEQMKARFKEIFGMPS
jgi:hypothetical protein